MSVPNVGAFGADDVFAAVRSLATKIVEATNRGGPVVLTHMEALHLVQAIAQLAQLAATEPQFDNPIRAWTAEAIRDRVLEELRR
jgi:hypothetical protein